MLTISPQFKHDSQTDNHFLIPLVIIEWGDTKRYISTNNITFDGKHYDPLLLSIPSISESIDLESRRYKISNVRLSISNFENGGIIFSNELYDESGNYILNATASIYWKSSGVKTLSDCLLLYNGLVRDIEHSTEKVSLSLEDASQQTVHKDIPKGKLSGHFSIPEQYRNSPVPMVYGFVPKSPCIIGETKTTDGYYVSYEIIAGFGDVVIQDNLSNETIIKGTDLLNEGTPYSDVKSYLYIYDNNKYAHVLKSGIGGYQQIGINGLTGDQTTTPSGSKLYLIGKTDNQGRANPIAKNKVECIFSGKVIAVKNWESYSGNAGVDGWTDLHSADNAYREHRYTNAILPFGGYREVGIRNAGGAFNNGDTGAVTYYTYKGIKHSITFEEPPLIHKYGSVKWNSFVDFNGTDEQADMRVSITDELVALYADGSITIDVDYNPEAWTNISWGLGLNVESSAPQEGFGYWAGIQTLRDEWFGSIGGLSPGVYAIDRNYSFIRGRIPTLQGRIPAVGELYFGAKYGNTNQQEDDVSCVITDYNIDMRKISLYHSTGIVDMKFFTEVQGNKGINNDLTPASIIIDIIQRELLNNQSLNYNTDEYATSLASHSGLTYAFTIKDRQNSKSIIERISKESKSFCYFNNNGEFSFLTVKDVYEISTYNSDMVTFSGGGFAYFIDRNDVIKYNFKRTPLNDVKTKIELLYNYDYGMKNYLNTTADSIISQTAKEYFLASGYSNTYYNISPTDSTDDDAYLEQGDDPVGLNYVTDKPTAESLHLYLLAWYCNQHTIFKLRLPLKYLKYEIGDIVAFKKLIEGRKAYGEDYSFNKRVLSPEQYVEYTEFGGLEEDDVEFTPEEITVPVGQNVIRNGQEIHPFFMITKTKKSLDYIDIEAMQLHNLTNTETGVVNIAPTARVMFELSDDAMETPPDVYDASLGTVPNIVLDGTGSTDPEGTALNYEWLYDSDIWDISDGNPLSDFLELEFTGDAPLPGNTQLHLFRLKVDDGEYSHISNNVRIYIINPIPEGQQTALQVDYMAGWNLVSLPVYVEDSHYLTIFPNATPSTCFEFNLSYFNVEYLEVGKAYWLHFEEAVSNTFIGVEVTEYTYQVASGWNLIGSLSEEFNVGDWADEENIVEGALFGFDGSYFTTETIAPGKGHWVRTNQSGEVSIDLDA